MEKSIDNLPSSGSLCGVVVWCGVVGVVLRWCGAEVVWC